MESETLVESEKLSNRSRIADLIIGKGTGMIGFIILFVLLSIFTDTFLTASNLFNVLRQAAQTLVMAVGMTFLIISGGIDLSAGSQVALSGVIAAGLIAGGMNPILAIILTVGAGAIIGTLMGSIISYQRIQPFIVTLATTTIFSGIAFVITQGRPIPITNDLMNFIGRGSIGPIPFVIVIMIIVGLFGHVLLRHTRFGRYVYALGDNEETARLSGIKTQRTRTLFYTLASSLFALAGVLVVARLGSGTPTAGEGSELDAIASVAIGGASMSGGSGTMGGTFIGVALMAVLNNGLNLMNVSSYNQMMIKGIVILAAVWLNSLRSNKKN